MVLNERDLSIHNKIQDAFLLFAMDTILVKDFKRIKRNNGVVTDDTFFRFFKKMFDPQNRGLIDTFCRINPGHLSDEELEIVASWKNAVHGRFLLFEYRRDYACFLSIKRPPIIYGVTGLQKPINELIVTKLPILVETILIPYKKRITHCGFLAHYEETIEMDNTIRLMLYHLEENKNVVMSLE